MIAHGLEIGHHACRLVRERKVLDVEDAIEDVYRIRDSGREERIEILRCRSCLGNELEGPAQGGRRDEAMDKDLGNLTPRYHTITQGP